MNELQRRFTRAEVRAEGKTLVGYSVVFNEPSEDLGGFRELINPHALDRTLKENPDIRALFNHDTSKVLGRTKSGTLRLYLDEMGLRHEVDLPDTPTGQEVRELVGRGDIDGCSFGFFIRDERWTTVDGEDFVEILDLDLIEVTPACTWPAYISTSTALRELPPRPSREKGTPKRDLAEKIITVL